MGILAENLIIEFPVASRSRLTEWRFEPGVESKAVHGPKAFEAKLDAYFERLKQRKAARIRPAHVRTIIGKLDARQQDLSSELATAFCADRRSRLIVKLGVVAEQLARADLLLDAIETRG